MSIPCMVGTSRVEFDLWRPGAILNGKLVAVDTETDMIVDGQVPNLMIASATDGAQGYFIALQHLEAFFAAHRAKTFVLHNAAFDLAVLERIGVSLPQIVDAGHVFDTGLLYRLLKLADTGTCHGKWSLDHVVEELLGIKLPKDARAADGSDVRTTFGRFLKADGAPDYHELLKPEHRPYLHYAGGDPVATLMLAHELNRWAQRVFGTAALNIFDPGTYGAAGAQDGVDLAPAWKKHGFLTHNIQLKASIALAAIERNGMYLDTEKVRGAVTELDAEIVQVEKLLNALKWAPGQGSQTAFDTVMVTEEKALNENFARTASGRYSRCGDDLGEYRQRSKFIDAYLTFQELTKTRNTFIAPLEKGGAVVRGRFNTMVNTGRTSCSGSRSDDDNTTGLNLQNLPREGVVRECLCARPGHFLFACDYSAIELVTLSQHCLARFGFSKMADAIKRGADLHALDASFRAGLDINTLPAWDKKSILKLRPGRRQAAGQIQSQEFRPAGWSRCKDLRRIRLGFVRRPHERRTGQGRKGPVAADVAGDGAASCVKRNGSLCVYLPRRMAVASESWKPHEI